MHSIAACSDTNQLISAGDTYVGQLVGEIMHSEVWENGRNVIVITWDEDDFADQGRPGTGCCAANIGGARPDLFALAAEFARTASGTR